MVQWIRGAIVWIQLGHPEPTRDPFIQDSMGQRWMGFIICQLAISALEVSKLVIEVSQLAVIFIEAVVSQAPNHLLN